MFSSGIIPILISNGCDRLTATRNQDGTFRLEAFIKVKQNEEDVDALVEVDRVLLNIEALVNPSDDHDDIFKLVIPKEERVQECFPAPSREEWELLGFNSSQAQMLTREE